MTEDYADQNGGYFTDIVSQGYKYDNNGSVQIYKIEIKSVNSSLESIYGKDRVSSYKQGILNNYQVFRSVSYPQYWSDDVFFQIKDNQFIEINFSPYDLEAPHPNQNDAHQIFNQMLSTFKFSQ